MPDAHAWSSRRWSGIVSALVVAAMSLAGPAAGRAQDATRARDAQRLGWWVDSLRIYVEGATRLKFKRPPHYGMYTPAQIRAYLKRVERKVPRGRLRAIAAADQLLGLIPDTTTFESAALGFESAQVAGFYDPETDTLYCRTGFPPSLLREVVIHEMVHALQAQHANLDPLIDLTQESDRAFAAKAVIEGQAMFATMRLAGGRNVVSYTGMRRVPLLLRESFIAPYLYGAEFMSAWQGYRWSDTVPFGRLMPQSSEQDLHPDRYRLYDTPTGPALVWYIVWDDPAAAAAFENGTGARLAARHQPGWRGRLEHVEVSGRAGTRYVWAPERWAGWKTLPALEVVGGR